MSEVGASPSLMAITVLIADDHDILRESLRQMLDSHEDLRVVAEAGDGAEAVRLAELHRPDVAVLDIGMKGMNGLEAAARISSLCPQTAILMLTVYSYARYVTRAIKAGARGYFVKESLDGDELVNAIRTLRNGGCCFSREIAESAAAAIRRAGDSA